MLFSAFLLQKYEENSHDKTEKRCKMIPLKSLAFEHYSNKNGKYCQGDYLLDDLKLHQVERTTVLDESDPVRRHLGTVFEKGYSP